MSGYDSNLSIFESLIPSLVMVFNQVPKTEDLEYKTLAEAVSILKNWDYYAK